jgi:hypothetical protein
MESSARRWCEITTAPHRLSNPAHRTTDDLAPPMDGGTLEQCTGSATAQQRRIWSDPWKPFEAGGSARRAGDGALQGEMKIEKCGTVPAGPAGVSEASGSICFPNRSPLSRTAPRQTQLPASSGQWARFEDGELSCPGLPCACDRSAVSNAPQSAGQAATIAIRQYESMRTTRPLEDGGYLDTNPIR